MRQRRVKNQNKDSFFFFKIKILNLLYIDDCDDWNNISPKAVTEGLRK